MPQSIQLKTQSASTEIIIPRGIESLNEVLDPASSIILADSNVFKLYASKLPAFRIIDAGEGEKAKTIEHAASLIGELLKEEIDRSSVIVGMGGGVITDLTGFIASVFLRGLRFGFVSTTLLGQVDASIGGKNGVNYKGYKNMIGTIRQPEFVYCDLISLHSLPEKDFLGGFSEIIKYAAIRRPELFPFLEENISKALKYDYEVLKYLVYESVMTKKYFVESDEREMGERKLLNFGHTFAHAIEKLYGKSHGEAVAIGMLMAAKLSVNLGMVTNSVPARLKSLLEQTGLPVELKIDPKAMAEVMSKDKKRKASKMSFILLEDIGRAIIHDIPVSELESIFCDL